MPTILILSANPVNTRRLRLDQETRDIGNGLRGGRHGGKFDLRAIPASRPEDVRRAILDLEPAVVHFCGHGSGRRGLAFEARNGLAHLVSADALADFFKLFASHIECVVLNACYSEVQAEAIAQHIDYVVGMDAAVDDHTAIEFAVAFYDALAAGKPYGFAFELACSAIQLAKLPGHLIPKFHCRPGITANRPSWSQGDDWRDAAGERRPKKPRITFGRVGIALLAIATALGIALGVIKAVPRGVMPSDGLGVRPEEVVTAKEIQQLILQLRSDNRTQQRYAQANLVKYGEEVVPELLLAIRDELVGLSRELSKIDIGSLLSALTSSRKTWETPMIEGAILVLGQIGQPATSYILEEVGRYSEYQSYLMSRLPSDDAADLAGLFKTLAVSSEMSEVGMAFWVFVGSLVEIGSPAVPELGEAMSDPQSWVRFTCVYALGTIAEPQDRVISLLESALQDTDQAVQEAAKYHLERLTQGLPSFPFEPKLKRDEIFDLAPRGESTPSSQGGSSLQERWP